MSVEKGWSDDRFDGAIAEKFNAAMSRLYGQDLYQWTREFLLRSHGKESVSEEEMARLIGISQSTVSRWKTRGILSIETLVTVLTKLGCEVAALPPLPSLQARMVEGYRGSMAWIIGAKLTTQDFIGFLSLWWERKWRAYVSRLKAGTAQLEEGRNLLAKLAPSVAQTMGKYLNRTIGNVSVEYLYWLDVTWREAWETCQNAIGYKWQID